jgi:hypothetical protein
MSMPKRPCALIERGDIIRTMQRAMSGKRCESRVLVIRARRVLVLMGMSPTSKDLAITACSSIPDFNC